MLTLNPFEEITPDKLVSKDGMTDLSFLAPKFEKIRKDAFKEAFEELFKGRGEINE